MALIEPVEDKAIAALKAGASEGDVNNILSRSTGTRIQQFEAEQVSLVDFESVEAPRPPQAPSSNRNRAAYSVALADNPEEIGVLFEQATAEMELEGTSNIMDQLIEGEASKQQQGARTALLGVLADPEIDDATKEQAANRVFDITGEMFDVSSLLASKAAVADVPFENAEQEKVRVNIASTFNEIHDYNRVAQASVNSKAGTADSSTANALKDAFEFISPFSESKQLSKIAARLNEELEDGNITEGFFGITLMGETKKDIIDTIRRIPPEQRIELTEKILNIVDQESSIFLPGTNDFARVAQLRLIGERGYISETERWFENIISVLDVVALGGILKSIMRPIIRSEGTGLVLAEVLRGEREGFLRKDLLTTGDRLLEAPLPKLTKQTTQTQEEFINELRAELIATSSKRLSRGDRKSLTLELNDFRFKLRNVPPVSDEPVRRVKGLPARKAKKLSIQEGKQIASEGSAMIQERINIIEERLRQSRIGEVAESSLSRLDQRVLKGESAEVVESIQREVIEPLTRSWTRRQTTGAAQPASISQTLKGTNPTQARAVHEIAVASEDGAQATHGVSSAEAVATDINPKVVSANGGFEAGLSDAGRLHNIQITPDAGVINLALDDGAIYYWKEEKAKQRTKVINDFSNSLGIRLLDNTSQMGREPDGIIIRAVYGPTDGSFVSPVEAVDQMKFNFRDYGVRDDDITLLRREGAEYRPIPDKEAKELIANNTEGEYLLNLDYRYRFNPLDFEQLQAADVKWNIFDRLVPGLSQGVLKIQRNVMDIASMLNPVLTLGAARLPGRAVALDKALLDLGSVFSKGYSSLKKERKEFLYDRIKEANYRGLNLGDSKLIALGHTSEEVQLMKDWRSYWDTHYYLENSDMAKSLRSQGFKALEDRKNGSLLFAKPTKKSDAETSIYSPSLDAVVQITPLQLDELYAGGGTLANLRDPLRINGDIVKQIVVKGTQEQFLRTLRDTDKVLTYRPGYYTVHYKNPKFVVKNVRDKAGNISYDRAVGVANNTKDAEHMLKRNARAAGVSPEEWGFVRGDVKNFHTERNEYWDVQSATGRTAQRFRGERLEDASGTLTGSADAHILDPVESLVATSRSISRRVAFRDYLSATKTRFLQQFGQLLPKNKAKQAVYPSSVEDIRKPGRENDKDIADARTTWEYINYLENGYINSIDEGIKSALRGISNVVGAKGFPKTEEMLNWASEGRGLTGYAKNVAFQAYLALNPLRQAMVQGHQAIQLLAIEPRYVSTLLSREIGGFQLAHAGHIEAGAKLSGFSVKEMKDLVEEVRRVGIWDGVSQHNLARGALLDIADNSSTVRKAVTAVPRLSQRIGFDSGEHFNIISAYLTFRNRALRNGLDPSNAEVRDTIAAEAINYTYNMNFAGDMPYNQNSAALVMQFQQVPHKAMLQLVNRNISPRERAQIAAFNLIVYGIPGAAFVQFYNSDIMPENQTARELLEHGLEQVMLNNLLTVTTGEETSINFRGFAAVDTEGLHDIITAMWTDGIGETLVNTPASSLLFGRNPRIANAFGTMARYFNLKDDYTDPTTFSQVAGEFAKIASGYSNFAKGRYALQYNKKINSFGDIVDDDVSTAEAIAQIFGFPTMEEAQAWSSKDMLWSKGKKFEEDVKTWYKDYKRRLVSVDIDGQDPTRIVNIMGEAWRMFGINEPRARQIIRKLLEKDVRDKDATFYRSALKAAQWMDHSEYQRLVDGLPLDEDKRRALKEQGESIVNNRGIE